MMELMIKHFDMFPLWCSVSLLIKNLELGENLDASLSSLFDPPKKKPYFMSSLCNY